MSNRNIIRSTSGNNRGIHKVLRGTLPISRGTRLIEKLRGRLKPRAGASTPSVVSIGRGHNKNRSGTIGGKGSNLPLNFANAFTCVTITITQDIIGRHCIHGLFCPGFRVHILHTVELIGVGSHIPSCVAGVRLTIPPAISGRWPKLVGFIRRTGKNVVRPLRIRLGVIGRTRAADVMAGHDDPLVSLVG